MPDEGFDPKAYAEQILAAKAARDARHEPGRLYLDILDGAALEKLLGTFMRERVARSTRTSQGVERPVRFACEPLSTFSTDGDRVFDFPDGFDITRPLHCASGNVVLLTGRGRAEGCSVELHRRKASGRTTAAWFYKNPRGFGSSGRRAAGRIVVSSTRDVRGTRHLS